MITRKMNFPIFPHNLINILTFSLTNCINLKTTCKWLFKKINSKKKKRNSNLYLKIHLESKLTSNYDKMLQVTVFYLETYFQI